MFVNGLWEVKPYTEKKVFDCFIISIDNSDLIIELNVTSYEILSLMKERQGSIITIDSIVKKIQDLFSVDQVTYDEFTCDFQEILDFFVECELIYQVEAQSNKD